MSSDWIETEWGQLATLEYGKGLRDYQADNGIYPVYGTNGRIGSCDSCLSPSAGIVIGRKGAYRGVHYSSKPFFVIDTAFWLKTKSDIDLKWAYYQLLTQDINSLDSGSAIPSTTRGAFYSLPVMLPGLSEQKAIAHILGTLDDKIELNRKTNETLEAIAKALFKSWFVDFDPVRAKAEGRPTGLPAEISDLFPDSFEKSELGEIPRGWETGSFLNLVNVISGGTPDTGIASYWNGSIPWFSVADAPTGSNSWVVSTEKSISNHGLENCSARLLRKGTTIITARGTVGKVCLVGTEMAMNQSCYALETKFERGDFYTFFLTKSLVGILDARGHGSVFNTITKDTLDGVVTVLPPSSAVDAFEQIAETLMSQMREHLLQTQSICSIRDTLLPKLISGELRIPDAEALVAEAGI